MPPPTFTPNDTQKVTLIVAGCYVIAIAILWHVPFLSWIIFRLLTVGFHEVSDTLAFASRRIRPSVVLLVSHFIANIAFTADEGGETRMSGGIPWISLPAGYLGSSFIGACLIACGFDTNASKVACLVLAVFFLFTLWWAKKNWLSWVLILGMSGLIVMFWFIEGGVALRYFVLFIGVMSDLYVIWDVIDDTIERKVNNSDASAFARICGCFPSQVWGVIWLIIAIIFFGAGVLIGIVAFKESAAQQKVDASHFLPVPGSSGAIPGAPIPTFLIITVTTLVWNLLA
ncbi:peptidase M50B-like-domain-containing protein [Pisolithus croceorrhizus]|nr:peptidase M50B-like-domain-containing protein [Pisolithus croceorrhizus]